MVFPLPKNIQNFRYMSCEHISVDVPFHMIFFFYVSLVRHKLHTKYVKERMWTGCKGPLSLEQDNNLSALFKNLNIKTKNSANITRATSTHSIKFLNLLLEILRFNLMSNI